MNLSFSNYFPAYHPRKGQRTYFVEKLWAWQLANGFSFEQVGAFEPGYNSFMPIEGSELESVSKDRQKFHTIRNGHRWKAGMKFKPVCWSGKPYNSKVFQFAPEIEVVKTWDLMIKHKRFYIDEKEFCYPLNPIFGDMTKLETLAKNDGLTLEDFFHWFRFPKEFSGQIICWDNSINY